MVLSTHAVIGAAAASLFPNHPVLAFSVAFGSHFVADMIPHWHYPVGSFVREEDMMAEDMLINRQFYRDLFNIGLDAFLGLAVSYLVFSWLNVPFWIIVAGVVGGILPDPLQFVYWKWRHEPIATLQRFHVWIHSKTFLDHKPLPGITYQILIALGVILVRWWTLK